MKKSSKFLVAIRNDYYNSCFRLYFFLFSVNITFKLFLARQQFWHWCLRTYLLYNACTDHHCSTGMHLGGHLFTCTYYVVVTLEIGSACTMSCAISRKYIQQHATSWNGIFCENNNKIGTSTQFVNKPIHYLFTAFNVISIAFFLHTFRSNL